MTKKLFLSQHRDMLGDLGEFRVGGEKMVCFLYQSIRLDELIPNMLFLLGADISIKSYDKKSSYVI